MVGKRQKIEREVRYPLLTWSNGSLLINPHRCEEDSNIIQLVWGRQQYNPIGVRKTAILSPLDTNSKIFSSIWKRTAINFWLSGLHTSKLHGTIISRWGSFLVVRNFPHLNSAHKTSFTYGGVSFLYYIFWWRHALRSLPMCVT